jgi:hypothetical protein
MAKRRGRRDSNLLILVGYHTYCPALRKCKCKLNVLNYLRLCCGCSKYKYRNEEPGNDIVTLDKSWFDDSTDHELIWLRPGEKVPERTHVSVSVQCRELMIIIVWNPTGFHLIRVIPNGCKFNSSYYQSEILGPLSEWRSGEMDKPAQQVEH